MKIKKETLASAVVILAILILAGYLIFNKTSVQTSADIAKCIGEKSAIYVQTGCPHCADQEAMFGDNFKYLNSTDCYYKSQTCADAGIEAVPTWVINGQKYVGVQSIETLQNLTGCSS